MVYRKLPEKAIVGRTKIDNEMMKTNDWFKAKNIRDVEAAKRIVQQKWQLQENKKERLKELFKNPDRTLIISQPSSSRFNAIPVVLSEQVANEYDVQSIDGNSLFKTQHNRASKNIPSQERIFELRKYIPIKKNIEKIRHKSIVLVDDILTTGGSVSQLCKTLDSMGIKVSGVIVLMGDPRVRITESTNKAINKGMKEKFPDMAIRKRQNFCESMTQGEGFNFLKTLNKTKTANVRQTLLFKIDKAIEHDRQFCDSL